jgi:hypothetical protein
MSLRDWRKSGDQTPYSVEVNFGESVNLAGTDITFSLKTLDFETARIDEETATPTDVTSEAGGNPPALSVWRLEYEPTSQEATVEESTDFLGRFTVVYAGGKPRYYPSETEYIRCSIEKT